MQANNIVLNGVVISSYSCTHEIFVWVYKNIETIKAVCESVITMKQVTQINVIRGKIQINGKQIGVLVVIEIIKVLVKSLT